MASSNHFLITIAIAALVLPRNTFGVVFIVGDGSGWTVGFDYAAWANDKEFHVGDKLVFMYPAEKHNVFPVNDTVFKNCAIPPPDEALTALNGMSVVLFTPPGRKRYFCGVGTHCEEGQKLAITVLPAIEVPAPAPTSENSTSLS